mmetsp:Transcript_44620/g.83309  ORF Transcript_44620/g.83309 Transcript_44620/m.83309 type:complete len:307 (-) Transcript_44620:490-1410(-)
MHEQHSTDELTQQQFLLQLVVTLGRCFEIRFLLDVHVLTRHQAIQTLSVVEVRRQRFQVAGFIFCAEESSKSLALDVMPVHPGERLRSLPILRIPVRISVDDLGRRPNKVRSVRTAVPEAHAAPPLREVVVAGRALRGRTLDREPGKHLRVTFAPSRCGAAHAALVFLAYQYLVDGHLALALDGHLPAQRRLHIRLVREQLVGGGAELHRPKLRVRAHARRRVDGVPKETVEPPLRARHRAHARPGVDAHLEVQRDPALLCSRLLALGGCLHHHLRHLHQSHGVRHIARQSLCVGALRGNAACHHG